ncbi:MAG: chemotaxis response regulator protein-glutamate methylesterase [Clostridia bacterium]|nr:chemotaxis response regulator protein-glutamate methylesterase [Clostridia bacterium]
MRANKKIRVLIVDDSLVFREVLSKSISADPLLEVVAKATDPFDARDKILEFEPDVMTCDVEMPKMNGIDFIRRLLPQYPLPVVVVSSVSNAVFEAMNVGAIDFVTKPNVSNPKDIERFINELIAKIKVAATAKVTVAPSLPAGKIGDNCKMDMKKIIAMGASTGGTEALFNILKCLPASIPGIVIVQHIPPIFSRMFAERLNDQTQLNVKEAQNGDYVEPGKVLIAPGDQHMIIKKIGDRYKINVFPGDKVNGHCPSVEVLFESVAKEAKNNAIGVILTGMGCDGAKGLLSMRRAGARTIGQDEHSSVVYGMPKAAYTIGAVEQQAPLNKISQLLYALLNK